MVFGRTPGSSRRTALVVLPVLHLALQVFGDPLARVEFGAGVRLGRELFQLVLVLGGLLPQPGCRQSEVSCRAIGVLEVAFDGDSELVGSRGVLE